METTTVFFTIQQIKDASRAAGLEWFDPDTMRFFRSRVSGPVIANMFVSSEDDRLGGGRRYTIRLAKPSGHIETVGEFQQYASKRAALRAIRRIAAGTCPACGGELVNASAVRSPLGCERCGLAWPDALQPEAN